MTVNNEDERRPVYRQLGEAPNPPPTIDPTVLTTQALTREIAAVRELIEQKISSTTQITGKEFEKVETQFQLIERQRVEQKSDTEKAVQAALSAAKEAVKEQTTASEKSISKSETATNELLKQLSSTFTTAIDSLRREIGEVKDRVTAIENQKQGNQENRTESRNSQTTVIAVISFGVMLILATLTIIGFAMAR